MGFHETPQRRLHLITGIGLLAVSITIASIPILVDVDDLGRWFAWGFAAVIAASGIGELLRARDTPRDHVVATGVDHLPPQEQAAYYRKMLLISLAAFPILAAWTGWELHQLEIGAIPRARLFWPLGAIYRNLGDWPAVFSPFALGGVCCTVFFHQLRRLGAPRPETAPS
ncbi:MAG TPA: hypothetical protein VNC50_17720, partial [Planctomycetia bacterium]|nr:hypothetical protein [Planctomycetia bacterium]